MDNNNIPSPCGSICNTCNHYKNDCHGCYETHGEPWWLAFTDLDKCEMFECCKLSGHLKHCGECNTFPCDLYDEGDACLSEDENKQIKINRINTIREWIKRDEEELEP